LSIDLILLGKATVNQAVHSALAKGIKVVDIQLNEYVNTLRRKKERDRNDNQGRSKSRQPGS
jgi:hypothetical protein